MHIGDVLNEIDKKKEEFKAKQANISLSTSN
jgi:hypothetical protein